MIDDKKYFKRAFIRKIAYILATMFFFLIANFFNILIVRADTTGTYTSASYEVKQCKQSCNVHGTNCWLYDCTSDSSNFNSSISFGSDNGHINRYQFLLYNNTSNGWDTGAWDITLQIWRRPNSNAQSILYNYNFYANDRATSSGAVSGNDTRFISNYVCQQWTNNEDWFIRCKFYNKVPIKFFMIELELPGGEDWVSGSNNTGIDNLTGLYWWGIDNFTGSTDATGAINNQTTIIQNEFNEVNSNINEINGTINDDSVDDPNSFFEDMDDFMPSNGVITQLIALPITLYTKILNSINGTCSSFSLGSLYNTNLVIPCIDVSEYLGSTLWGVIDAILSGFLVLGISRKFIKAFNNFTSLKEGDVIND